MAFDAVAEMDRELARLAHQAGALRLELGAGLEALARIGGHHELGFSSVEAYALERCERSSRWTQETRWLARRLEQLPAVRAALVGGRISVSMAQVVARAAHAHDETEWLARAMECTVREMRRLVADGANAVGSHPNAGLPPEIDPGTDAARFSTAVEEERAALTITVDREDAWLFECARTVVRRVAGLTMEETVEALLGEGTASLLSVVARGDLVPFDDAPEDVAQREWEAQLAAWRAEAEARCDARLAERRAAESVPDRAEIRAPTFDGDATAIDSRLRGIAAELARRDLELGRLAETLWNADGWRRLGYASDAHYGRERLGLSLSSVQAKRALARCAERMPRLASAITEGALGYEAARLVASVATPETVDAWVARASRRTVKCLREEVDAATMLGRLRRAANLEPPDDATMRAVADLETRIVSGAAFQQTTRSPDHAGGSTLDAAEVPALAAGAAQISAVGDLLGGRPDAAAQMSALLADLFRPLDPTQDQRGASPGRITLRLPVGLGTRRYYRWLERTFQRRGPRGVSFLRFLCCSLIDAWRPNVSSSDDPRAYAGLYARDRYRCASPVCGRCDVTPHHLRFRSAGGDDSTENLAALCVWCHLGGVHGGRLRATPPASDIEWTIGRAGHTTVRGRHRERTDDARR